MQSVLVDVIDFSSTLTDGETYYYDEVPKAWLDHMPSVGHGCEMCVTLSFEYSNEGSWIWDLLFDSKRFNQVCENPPDVRRLLPLSLLDLSFYFG